MEKRIQLNRVTCVTTSILVKRPTAHNEQQNSVTKVRVTKRSIVRTSTEKTRATGHGVTVPPTSCVDNTVLCSVLFR